jgi:hypothetical protein
MNSFKNDSNNEEVLLSSNEQQVMMKWEKPYMEESINMLEPSGDVLEIGFGCGYSATQILKHHTPKSYTVIECDPVVIEKAKEWRKDYPQTPIHIVEGTWQEKLSTLGKFDEIYFDDFPLNINKNSSKLEIGVSQKRHHIFIDLCIQNHTRIGSRICWYLNGNPKTFSLGSDTEPFVEKYIRTIDIKIPDTCKYRNIKEQKCTIPLVIKVKEYDFTCAQRWAMRQNKNIIK